MIQLIGEEATLEFAANIASKCQPPLIIYLQGDLGSGKTTFLKRIVKTYASEKKIGLIQNALGYHGNVKSPTFTLVETYDLENLRLYHFDLYRLNDPLELEYIGIRDLVGEKDVICLIEWPERARSELPSADLEINLEYQGVSRGISCQAKSTAGQRIIDNL